MMKKDTRLLVILSLFVFPVMLLLYSCYRPPVASSENWQYNFASIYNPGESALHPEYCIYHQNDSLSLFFFRVNAAELVTDNTTDNINPHKGIVVKYVMRNSETNQIADSASILYKVSTNKPEKEFITYIKLKTPEPKKYNLVVIFSDVIRKVYRRVYIEVDKTNDVNSQNYFVETADSVKTPLFQNFVDGSRKYVIYKKRAPYDKYFISYYKPINTIPQSPFAAQYTPALPTPDSVYTFNAADTLSFATEGIYLITTQSAGIEGITLVNFGNEYPQVLSAQTMIESLRYLTTERRWNDMVKASDKKTQIDNFWLGLSADPKKAKELIRVYYNRVILANEFFASFKQGWQTDRGMIYIIFGPPATIYKSPDTEQWIYGDNPELSLISFTFKKTKHLLTNNDYTLVREQRYQTIWAQAIETWLQGRVFSIN